MERIVQPAVRISFRIRGLQKGSPKPCKGPSSEVIQAIVDFKKGNPLCGCPRIAQQISNTFGIAIDKDIVRRVLASHYKPESNDGVLPGWPFSVIVKTVFGAWISSKPSRFCSRPTGSWLLWTSIPAGSSVSPYSPLP